MSAKNGSVRAPALSRCGLSVNLALKLAFSVAYRVISKKQKKNRVTSVAFIRRETR
jgi:hypothetical protein